MQLSMCVKHSQRLAFYCEECVENTMQLEQNGLKKYTEKRREEFIKDLEALQECLGYVVCCKGCLVYVDNKINALKGKYRGNI